MSGCPGCGVGKGCLANTDCLAPATCVNFACTCVPKTCASLGLTCGTAPDGCGGTLSCDDGVKNGTETDVDCGGGCATKCGSGKACTAPADCASASCVAGACAGQPCVAWGSTRNTHTCAAKGDGTLWCWGKNVNGQAGDGTTTSPKTSPVQVTALGATVVEVSAGYEHTCARKGDGTLWCWGANDYGKVGDGTMISPRLSPVQVTTLGTSVVQVSAGSNHTCARKGDGTLWCWGWNGDGQLGLGMTTSSKLSPVQVTSLGNTVVQVATGSSHTCARKSDGTLWCFGYDNYGQIGDGTTAASKPAPVQVTALGNTVAEVVAGGIHTCARKGDGTVWCWGDNSSNQIGNGSAAMAQPSPVQVTTLGNTALGMAAGAYHTCARMSDGTAWCWGNNGGNQLGSSTAQAPTTPVQANLFGSSIVQLACGYAHTCVRKNGGTFGCLGSNTYGEVGNGTTTPVYSLLFQAVTCP